MKVRNIINMFGAVSIAFMTVACANDDVENYSADNAVTFSASLGDELTSRANLYLSQWTTNKDVAVKSLASGTTKHYMATNINGSGADIVAYTGITPFYWGNDGNYNFEAWIKGTSYTSTHPSGTAITAKSTFTSWADQDNDVLLYASGAYSRTKNKMYFYHQKARLSFQLYNDPNENVFTKGDITSLTIGEIHDGTKKIYTKATWTKPALGVKYGTWTGHTTASVITAASGTTSASILDEYKAMVIPYNYNTGVCLTLTTSKGTYYCKIPAAQTNWEAGYHYFYTLHLHAGYIELTSVTATLDKYVEDTSDLWQSETQTVGGTIGEYVEAETNIFK